MLSLRGPDIPGTQACGMRAGGNPEPGLSPLRHARLIIKIATCLMANIMHLCIQCGICPASACPYYITG